MQQRLYAFLCRIKAHQADDLIVVCADLMYLGCKFRELAVVLHGGPIYCYHLETLSEYSGTHEIGLAYCPGFVV